MAFSQDFLQELSDRNPIEDVVGEYVQFTKRSGQNLFGLCPFHSEKTPSFSVSPSKQIYHCFGCGKGGSVINFIMEIENLSFPEAVEFLARRAGMKVPEQQSDPGKPKRDRLYALNRDAARFFYEQLSTPAGAAAVDYMLRRGITPGTARRFGLGCAPESWDALCSAMKEKGYTERELYDAGLVRRGKKGGVYDAFRGRLMFPVIDVRGNVIAFSGRALGDVEPKYLNSPETPVFSKSHNLFGLNLAKKSKSGYIILVEGNIDVVSLHQAGFDSAVASLGTSLTPEQARLISRFKQEVVIAYDADEAGKKAAQRAIGILEKLELKVRVLTVRGAKDPDEFIKAKGPEAFQNLLAESENHVEYRCRAREARPRHGRGQGGLFERGRRRHRPAARQGGQGGLRHARGLTVRRLARGGAGRGQAAAPPPRRRGPAADRARGAPPPAHVPAPGARHPVQKPPLRRGRGGRHTPAEPRPLPLPGRRACGGGLLLPRALAHIFRAPPQGGRGRGPIPRRNERGALAGGVFAFHKRYPKAGVRRERSAGPGRLHSHYACR